MRLPISLRLEPQVKERLEHLAQATQRSRSQLIAEAVNRYLETEEWQVQGIHAAIEQAEAGELVEHEHVAAWLDSWGTEEEQEPPR